MKKANRPWIDAEQRPEIKLGSHISSASSLAGSLSHTFAAKCVKRNILIFKSVDVFGLPAETSKQYFASL